VTTLRLLILSIAFGLVSCDTSSTEAASDAATSLPDREAEYTPTTAEKARAESLTEFNGMWRGKIVPLIDRNGVYREYEDGIEIQIDIDGDKPFVYLLLNGEWTPIIAGEASFAKNRSSVFICNFIVDGGYTNTLAISMHRAEPDVARVSFMRTAGTPFRSGDDVWKSWSVFAEGQVKFMLGPKQ
jgi:hypothetical protein